MPSKVLYQESQEFSDKELLTAFENISTYIFNHGMIGQRYFLE